jgi:hypothetical protein
LRCDAVRITVSRVSRFTLKNLPGKVSGLYTEEQKR